MARSASQPLHVTQFNQATHQIWPDRLEQAARPQEFRDGGTLGTCDRTLHRHFDVLSFYRFSLTRLMYLLQQALDLAVREFQDSIDLTAQSGGSSRSIQWSGLRYMLAEVRMSNNVN